MKFLIFKKLVRMISKNKFKINLKLAKIKITHKINPMKNENNQILIF